MMRIKVLAKEDMIVYNHDYTKILSEVRADDMMVATFHELTEEFFAQDRKGRLTYVGQMNFEGQLELEEGFVIVKEEK